MDALIHWDFSPGLAVEAQVRRHFGSSVHFSPSSGSSEFFLVVSFSSASFLLTEETVGLALQSCIGGDRHGFRVFQTSDRRFRFSVASNKVGHFIYGLRDRVWPDFVCHFSLYRGVLPSASGFFRATDYSWSSTDQNLEVAQRSPTALRPNLNFLKQSALRDQSSSSELAKFGFSRDFISGSDRVVEDALVTSMPSSDDFKIGYSVVHPAILAVPEPPTILTNLQEQAVSFGQFSFKIPDDPQSNKFTPKFAGRDFWSSCMNGCNFLDPYWLNCALDLRQANYSKRQFREHLISLDYRPQI
jgi:hypothetical protein